MPELPEVETVRASLLPHLPGRRVDRLVVRDPYVIKHPGADELTRRLRGQTFQRLERTGKMLLFFLDDEVLFVHLGMTGQLTFRDPRRADTEFIRHQHTGLQRTLQHPVDKHTHLSLEFPDGTALHYRDIRKFGRWRLFKSGEYALTPEFRRLGVDPLTEKFTLDYLADGLKDSKRPIKARLLDQSFIAGLGNIYVDEALFRAGVRPGRGSHRLNRKQIGRLYLAIREVLLKGIENGGTTLRDFLDGQGYQGSNQERLLVYGRYGEACPGCGEILRRSTVGGRTSSWCAKCQV